MKRIVASLVLISALNVHAQSSDSAMDLPDPSSGAPAAASEPAVTEPAPVEKSLNAENVRRTIKDITLGELKKCYEETLTTSKAQNLPIPKGKVVVDFSFDSEGVVTEFKFKENRVMPASETLNTCIETSIRQTKFSKLQNQRSGKIVNVFYPFIFEPAKTKKK